MTTLFAALAAALSRSPERVALVTETHTFTCAELLSDSARYAGALVELGVRSGERVAVQTDKSASTLLLYLGCLRIGAVYVPLNTAYTVAEVSYFLKDAQPCLLVCEAARHAALVTEANACGVAHTIALAPATLQGATSNGAVSLSELAARARPHSAVSAPQEIAAILYTSGTTGHSKGAMLTNANLLSNAQTLVQLWGCCDTDVLLHALPIYHVHGLFVAIHTALLSGTRVLFHSRFDPTAVIADLPKSTLFMGVPTYYTRLLADARFDRAVCANMRLFISGSAPLRPETFVEFEIRTGRTILERYGMTEAGMITSNALSGERRAGSVGLPLPGVDVRVSVDGALFTRGGPGVLQIRGPNVFAGYWRMPEKTLEEFTADGYFITGDIAEIDDDGVVSLTGRAKDLIICGGLNVYPKEIELIIDSFAGVEESAIIGVPHPDFGEAVVAVIKALPDAELSIEQIAKSLREQLASFKLPKHIAVVDALPRNAMGKVQKNLLRENFASLFDAQATN